MEINVDSVIKNIELIHKYLKLAWLGKKKRLIVPDVKQLKFSYVTDGRVE